MPDSADRFDCPPVLQPVLEQALVRLGDVGAWDAVVTDNAAVMAQLERVLACSEYAAGVIARAPELLAEIVRDGRAQRSLTDNEYEQLWVQGQPAAESEAEFMRRLRLFRHRELLRIVLRDLAGWSATRETLRDLSALADTCSRAALLYASAALQTRYGVPRNAAGEEARLVVVAMGKLGGGELNFSSDIDVVFIYSEGGTTDGSRATSNEEYFRRVAQQFIHLLSKATVDGFAYRVDARLRPFGDSGPLACSAGAFEDYLVEHGRDWERYAWVKARAINRWEGTRDFYRQVLRPFVYRRYLDFGVFASLREMKAMIEREERAAENRDNIKLGPGGIREIEFIVQTLQLVRGGTIKNLRERSLLRALAALGAEELMPDATVAELTDAYLFLRDLENRLQAIADRQTHELPTGEIDRARLVAAMRYANWEELYAALNIHRDVVKADFERILRHERGGGDAEAGAAPAQPAWEYLAEQSFAEPEEALRRVSALHDSRLVRRMDDVGRQRLEQLIPRLLVACGAQGGRALAALDGVLRIVEAIGRRSAYLALLNENQPALERLVSLSGSSDFLSRQVAAHPLLLDELLDQRALQAVPTRADFEQDLQDRMDDVAIDESEQRFEALRNFQQAAVFRVAVTDLSGALPLMKVSDRLTDIAELVLAEAIALAVTELSVQHGRPHCTVAGARRVAGFAIAGYGKLGGLELGYGSDLDIVFLHDSEGDEQQTDGPKPLDNAVYFARLARRITHILTMVTPTGALYEVDTRLRPSGNSGLLVTSIAALAKYQREEAWTWEHQALLRARPVAGATAVQAAFAALRVEALQQWVRRDTLAAEVTKMRARMRGELDQSTATEFHIKQGTGGMIDIEFLVQYLVLLHAPEAPELIEWSDNIRQLEALGRAGILEPDLAEALADAYRAYRTMLHSRSLAGEAGLVPPERFAAQRELVLAQWQKFLGAE